MQTINILDFSVANMIAAGEVVERPASVVKELIENAVDAGAKEISLEIRHGGVSYVRVTDNGKGMSREDAEICILRHATSKIKNAKDLDAILTLGFRGEALAAISSVCQMSILTKRASDPAATEVICDCGRIVEVNEVGAKNGTTVTVRELFANVPARRKFLKRDQAEGMACAAVVEKEALAHPEIAFTMISDGSVRLKTAGDGKLFNAVYALLGRDLASRMIKVQGKNDAVEVFGYIGRPDNVRANRNQQNFFINGRYVKSRTATAALEQGFSSFIEKEKFPACVLNVVLHPALVDVNVHPTKLEVKFSNEKIVFDAVYLAVRNALLNDVSRPEMLLERKDVTHKAIETYNAFAPVYDRMDGERSEQTGIFSTDAPPPPEKKEKEDPPGKTTAHGAPFDDLSFIFEDIARQMDGSSPAAAEPLSEVLTTPVTSADGNLPEGSPDGSSEGSPAVSTAPDATASASFPSATIPGATHPSESSSGASLSDVSPDPASREAQSADPLIPPARARGEETPPTLPPEKGVSGGDARSQSDEPDDGAYIKEDGFKLLGVAFDTYILAQIGDKLMVIDKHAAHERLLFEKMKANLARSDKRITQLLIVPETIRVSYAECNAALEYQDELEAAGYTYTVDDPECTVLLSGMPGQIDQNTARELFTAILTGLASGEGDVEVSRKIGFEKALYTASCKAAMKGSRYDGDEHVKYLLRELLRLPDIRYCPHGRPVAFEIPKGSIEHKFKRS